MILSFPGHSTTVPSFCRITKYSGRWRANALPYTAFGCIKHSVAREFFPFVVLLILLCNPCNIVQAKSFDFGTLGSSSSVAFTNVTLIDGRGGPAKEQVTVLIDDGKITGVHPKKSGLKPGYYVQDLSSHIMTPGFVMMHEHLHYPAGDGAYNEMHYSFPSLYLAGGVTTARTAGSMSTYGDLSLKHAIAEGLVPGPDLDVTGPYLTGPGSPVPGITIYKRKTLSGPDSARKMLHYWLNEGVTSQKVYMHIREDEFKTVLKIANQNRQKVTGHLCSITYRKAAELGINNIEHGFLVASDFVTDKKNNQCPSPAIIEKSILDLPLNDTRIMSLINVLVQKDVAITSTLAAFETFAAGRPIAPIKALDLMTTNVKQIYLNRWSSIQNSDRGRAWHNRLKKEMAWEKMFYEAGGLLLAGTDPTGYGGIVPGISSLRQIQLLIEANFSPAEAVKIATYNGAKFLDQLDTIGTIEVGKRANMVIFSGRPHSRTFHHDRVVAVIKDGQPYDSQRIFQELRGIVGLR